MGQGGHGRARGFQHSACAVCNAQLGDVGRLIPRGHEWYCPGCLPTAAPRNDRFEPKPEPASRKWRCKVCHAEGYPPNGHPWGSLGHWSARHTGEHAPCAYGCGVVLPVRDDGSPRKHSKCPAT